MAGVDEGRTTRSGGAAFFDEVHGRIAAGDRAFHLIGTGAATTEHVNRLPEVTHRRVWSTSDNPSIGSMRRGHRMTADAVAQGVDCRGLISPAGLRVRLLPSMYHLEGAPGRVTPLAGALLLADDVLLVRGRRAGPQGPDYWRTEDAEVVRAAAETFLGLWERATPVEDVALLPLLDARSLEVAFAMMDGDTDAEIAARLGIGARTVQVAVRRVVDWCGARNRTHAVALMAGSDA
ncbi:helix-turn-helix transcriptional regulator [Oryzobacter sp. R7]|uniref:helix-turn-helix transcriptional regulator n=1 Tax=Oryzobacter faecalis TaxID=3388656 RepID=UPI00398D330C